MYRWHAGAPCARPEKLTFLRGLGKWTCRSQGTGAPPRTPAPGQNPAWAPGTGWGNAGEIRGVFSDGSYLLPSARG